MNQTLKNQLEKTLAEVIANFKSSKDINLFFKDFLTPKELEILSKRLAVGYWLIKKRSYTNIQNNLKVSSATIAQVKVLMQKNNFKKALKNLEAEDWAQRKSLQIRRLPLFNKVNKT